VPTGLETVLAIDGLETLLELAGQARDAPDDPDRRVIEIRTLAAPLLEDQVDAVAFWRGRGPPLRRGCGPPLRR
jgi:hypothetical protein